MTKNQLKKIVQTLLKENPSTERDLLIIIRREAGKFKCPPPAKAQLLSEYHKLQKNRKQLNKTHLERLLTKRAVRTMSGVAVISVLTKPYPCPGKCLYCPTEKAMPKSYLSNEPAVMRAILNEFDPYRQVRMRLQALKANGHITDKVELIVMGGTWSYHRPQYQTWFIKRCFEALNGRRAKNLASAQRQNETAKHRCIGLTLETRPDFITEAEIIKMRVLGCTRVELGIQHINNKILTINRRGHDVKQSIKAIELLKTAGFKINYHLMLNLPGATPASDLNMFKKLYSDSHWMPDMIKIYPCVVTKNSPLYKDWKQGQYQPYSDRQLLNLIIKIKKITPPWVRITRLIRDIPEESIEAGNKITNLRQLVQEKSRRDSWNCRCIRCREAGHQNMKSLNHKIIKSKPKLVTRKYPANNGKEYFLSYESPDSKVLYAFLRLRINNQPDNFIRELKNSALIREIHTYGQLIPLGQSGKVQHSGLGKKLIKEAEKICKKEGIKKMAVISGIGVRNYYRQLGYSLKKTYLIKEL